MAMKAVQRDEIDRFFDYDVHVPSRTIYMGSCGSDWEGGESGVDYLMAERAVKALHVLDTVSNTTPILIKMSNPGGDWYHGMAIYDAIRACQSHVTIQVVGMAMSMGSIILQAADERVMMPNARFMIHYGTDGVSNHSKIVQQWAKESAKIMETMEQIYMEKAREKRPLLTLDELKAMLNFDTILSAEETVAMGWADRVSI